MKEAAIATQKPWVMPETNEQKGLAILGRIEELLKTIADNTRPQGTKVTYSGKRQ